MLMIDEYFVGSTKYDILYMNFEEEKGKYSRILVELDI